MPAERRRERWGVRVPPFSTPRVVVAVLARAERQSVRASNPPSTILSYIKTVYSTFLSAIYYVVAQERPIRTDGGIPAL